MVNWSREKDQVLFKGVLQFCSIKMSGEMLQYLASAIGEGCTVKAVKYRLLGFKNHGGPIRNPTSYTTSTKSTPSKVTKSSPAKSPGSGHGRGRAKKKIDDDGEPTNDLDGFASPTAGRRRSGTAEPTTCTQEKKIETEDFEDTLFEDAVEEFDDSQTEL